MSKQNGNKGRRFDRAFKEEAVRLLPTRGRRQREIAGDLGIGVSALGRWVTELREEDWTHTGASAISSPMISLGEPGIE